MIIIVEGIDRVGKTTLCNKFKEKGFLYLKDSINIPSEAVKEMDFDTFSLGKIDTTISLLELLNDAEVNVIMDRLHLTELVYGLIERSSKNVDIVSILDKVIAVKLNPVLILITPTDIDLSCKKHGKDLYVHEKLFRKVFQHFTYIEEKHVTNFNELDSLVEKILGGNQNGRY